VLRIGLDRVMGQFPPGTFLAPEDEVAASLSDPGYLRISGELVVTQLSEGVARVAWADIADQFPSHLVGLSTSEISEHLGDGLRLPLDEVIGQLPHELFVADTPEIEMPGLDRVPVPFHPLEESTPAPQFARAVETAVERPLEVKPTPQIKPAPDVELLRTVVPPVVPPAPAVPPPAGAGAPPTAPVPVGSPAGPVAKPVQRPEPPSIPQPPSIAASPAVRETGEPTVRISFGRVAAEIPADVFHLPLDELAERMQQPGALLIPQSVVLPQLAEGLIRVTWDIVAPQFPHDQMTVSDAEMAERLPNGIRLPLDEIVRQVPPDLFMSGGPAADVRGLESFPAPFQPLLSDPAPEPPRVSPVTEPNLTLPEPAPVVVAPDEPATMVVPDPVVPSASGEADVEEPVEIVEPDPPPPAQEPVVIDEPAPPVVMPVAGEEPRPAPEARGTEPPLPQTVAPSPARATSAPIAVAPTAGTVETAEARRIVALLAPIASFDVSIQVVEGVTVYAVASPTVAQETTVAVAGLALPLVLDRRMPWPVDQITLRGPETALVLTPLGGPGARGPVLAAAAPRGGALALLEILCRRAARDRVRSAGSPAGDAFAGRSHSLAPAPASSRTAGLTSSLTAFGDVTASVLLDAESEAVLYFFLPAGGDVPAVGAFAQDLHAVMRKAAGSGAVFRTAILRSGDTLLVIQPEEIGHGRSIVIVAGGPVTRPGLAYRQVERAAATLMSA
jgi:hypothetical protein